MLLYTQNLLWDIPRCNIYATIMPDLLHQIKKGIWSHLLNWFQALLQDIHDVQEANEYLDEMDKHFALVPSFKDIKSFLKGICSMEQITAGEYTHIMKINLETIWRLSYSINNCLEELSTFNFVFQIFLPCARGFFTDQKGI